MNAVGVLPDRAQTFAIGPQCDPPDAHVRRRTSRAQTPQTSVCHQLTSSAGPDRHGSIISPRRRTALVMLRFHVRVHSGGTGSRIPSNSIGSSRGPPPPRSRRPRGSEDLAGKGVCLGCSESAQSARRRARHLDTMPKTRSESRRSDPQRWAPLRGVTASTLDVSCANVGTHVLPNRVSQLVAVGR